MISLGPFPMTAILLALGAIAALLVARSMSRHAMRMDPPAAPVKAGPVLVDMLLVGLLTARLVYVAASWPGYAADPWSIVRIGDGGFTLWAGLVAGLGWGLWQLRRRPALRVPLLAGTAAGLAVWALLSGALLLMQQSTVPLPTLAMTTLDGERRTLQELPGRPMVVNLWATWCPPCRREMPVLAHAQAGREDIQFVFINEGEGPDRVRDYLRAAGLELENVLLDPFSSVMQEVGSRGLPTTLFFDADGRLVEAHMGELSAATLADKLAPLSPPAGTPRGGGAAQTSPVL